MSRTYNKFNSTRAKAEFARNALAGTLVAAISTANLDSGIADGGSGYPATGWADAGSKQTLNTGTGVYGDAGDWSETDSGEIILQPGTYQFEVNASIKMTTAGPGVFHYSFTDDAYAVLYESQLPTGLTITNQNENGVLSGFFELEIAAETRVLFHIAGYSTADGTLNRGPHSQITIRKIA